MIYTILISIGLAAYASSSVELEPRAGCDIDPLLYPNSPLVISSESEQFLYPAYREITIHLGVGDTVDLVCPGALIVVDGELSQQIATASCAPATGLRTVRERAFWSQIHCSGDAEATSRFTGRSCESGGREAEIGFSLVDGRFLTIIVVCFDTVYQAPLYTYYNLTASIGNNAKGTPRPLFSQDTGFYDIGSRTVNQLYTRAVQRSTINGLIGLNASSLKYIDNGSWLYLARGHLTARADFFYPAQQNGTFRYINAAPQWQSFNGINWNEAEQSTRAYADRHGLDLQVWTGIYGVTTLPHETTGSDTELFIYAESGRRALQVPALYWKVVYEPISRRGVALIGLNNPYQEDVSKNIICPDVSDALTWVTWEKHNISSGYSYACSVTELRKVISYAPDLPVVGLLL